MTDDVQVFLGAAAVAIGGYALWRRTMRAANLMEGTATSRVATAAKGYVELSGTARGAGGAPVRDPIEGLACLWFKVVTERRSGNDWDVERRQASIEPLSLQDATGSCLIIPGEAKIDEEQEPDLIVKETASRRHKIWRVHDGDPLYALGFLERRNPPLAGPMPGSIAADHAGIELLRVWKRDQAKLLARFDENRDGRVDAAEWERARRAAQDAVAADAAAEAQRSRAAAATAPDAHISHRLSRPDDGRPLLIASRPESELLRRMKWRSRLGLLMFIGGTLYILYALTRYFP